MRLWLTNARDRTHYNLPLWKIYLKKSGDDIEKISIYNNDYYRYLRGVSVIRDLKDYEKFYMQAYDEVIFGVKKIG